MTFVLPSRRRAMLGMVGAAAMLSACRRAPSALDDPKNWVDPVTAEDWRTDPDAPRTFVNLAKHENNDGMALSNDARFAAYCRNFAPGHQIELIDLAEGAITRIEGRNPLIKLRDLSFSADGRRLLMTASPPMYRGMSRILEMDIETGYVRPVDAPGDLLFRQVTYGGDDEVVTGFATASERTNDGRFIPVVGYRDAFFLRLGRLRRGEAQPRQVSTAPISDIHLLGASADQIVFRASGWVTQRDGVNHWGSLEQRFPKLQEFALLIALSPSSHDGEPQIVPASVEGIQRLRAILRPREQPRLAAALRDGTLVYLLYNEHSGLRSARLKDGAMTVGDDIKVGFNITPALNAAGDFVMIGHSDELPEVVAWVGGRPGPRFQPGQLARRPTRQIEIDIDGLPEATSS